MTKWGVLWRACFVSHPLLAIWVGLAMDPSADWQRAGSQLAAEYFWYGFFLTPLLLAVLHLAVEWVYAQRRYALGQALWVGLLSGSVGPGVGLLFLLVMLSARQLTGLTLTPTSQTLTPGPHFWLGLLFYLGLGQLLALPHWLFYRRLPSQQALRA